MSGDRGQSMKLKMFQIDAFAEKVFEGNPAAVVPLETWLPDSTMQSIAAENNLAETAFFVPTHEGFHIRWFTPVSEVKLCGHATLASAFLLFTEMGYEPDEIVFDSLSGPLRVKKEGELLALDFPNQMPEPCDIPEALIKGLGKKPVAVLAGEDYVAVFEHEADVADIVPDHSALEQLGLRGVIATAPSVNYDFVARFFAPKFGIPEDPVTGSAYTHLTPYWAGQTGRKEFTTRQISSRGGDIWCRLDGDRVLIAGKAVKFFEGMIEL